MELFDSLLNSATSIFDFIKSIPNMLLSCLSGFPDSIASVLITCFFCVIAIRILELVF